MSNRLQFMKRKTPGRCVFCGLGDLSKEHIWPGWAADLLPNSTAHVRIQAVRKRGQTVEVPLHWTRPGSTKTNKLRVVCRSCNGGWMGQLETAAKPYLTDMAQGLRVKLDRAAVKALTEWFTLKIMVLDRSDPTDSVFAPEHRRAFYESREIPHGLQIDLLRCGQGDWRAAYRRHAGMMSNSPTRPSTEGRKNVCSFALGFGQLLLFALWLTDVRIRLDRNADALTTLWPIGEDARFWPPRLALTEAEAETLANTLGKTFMADWVRWAD